jgi:16S rRNA (adenine1518-N6/adenine1519-N6)-dimethyltransferase
LNRPRLKKRLGQHHLVRPEACRPLVDFLAPAGERVLEIGPGGGVLTRALLEGGARVWGAELDLEWAWQLRHALAGKRAVQLVAIDALDLAWERLPEATLVAGNLPYNVATPIVAALLPHHRRVPRAAFLLQKEVAERLTAKPGTRDYGALTVLVECHAEATILGRVKPGAFRPPPKVDSAFVGFRLRPPPLPDEDLPSFLGLVREGFGQKRKTLRNSLGRSVGPERVLAALERMGLPPTSRAEELSLERWLSLWSLLR